MKLTKQTKNERRASIGGEYSKCPKCGHFGRHYVASSMGEEGFFICDAVGDDPKMAFIPNVKERAIIMKKEPKEKPRSTARSRLAKRAESWKIDVETDRFLNSMKIFGRRNK